MFAMFFVYVYTCLQLFTPRLHVFTYVYLCSPMFTRVYLCLPLLTRV